MTFLLLAGAAGILMMLAGALGYEIGRRRKLAVDARQVLRDLGFTERTADLYQRAARLLKSLVAVTDLDGPFGADILSEETRKKVNDWLAAYRKEITKL